MSDHTGMPRGASRFSVFLYGCCLWFQCRARHAVPACAHSGVCRFARKATRAAVGGWGHAPGLAAHNAGQNAAALGQVQRQYADIPRAGIAHEGHEFSLGIGLALRGLHQHVHAEQRRMRRPRAVVIKYKFLNEQQTARQQGLPGLAHHTGRHAGGQAVQNLRKPGNVMAGRQAVAREVPGHKGNAVLHAFLFQHLPGIGPGGGQVKNRGRQPGMLAAEAHGIGAGGAAQVQQAAALADVDMRHAAAGLGIGHIAHAHKERLVIIGGGLVPGAQQAVPGPHGAGQVQPAGRQPPVVAHNIAQVFLAVPAQILPGKGRQGAQAVVCAAQQLQRAQRRDHHVQAARAACRSAGQLVHGQRPVRQRSKDVQLHGGMQGKTFPEQAGRLQKGRGGPGAHGSPP